MGVIQRMRNERRRRKTMVRMRGGRRGGRKTWIHFFAENDDGWLWRQELASLFFRSFCSNLFLHCLLSFLCLCVLLFVQDQSD